VRLSRTPELRTKGVGGSLCGLFHGEGVGHLVNVVNTVRYEIRNLSSDSNYAPIYAASAVAPYDADRTELARVELDTAGNVIDGTQELVTEYAVNLKFGLTAVNSVLNGSADALTTLPPGDAAIAQWAGPTPSLAVNRGPQLARAVRIRLSVRSREADRDSAVTATSTVAPGLYRIGLGSTGGAPYARVRTLQADIGLRNQMLALW
jgi:hypothetical protein